MGITVGTSFHYHSFYGVQMRVHFEPGHTAGITKNDRLQNTRFLSEHFKLEYCIRTHLRGCTNLGQVWACRRRIEYARICCAFGKKTSKYFYIFFNFLMKCSRECKTNRGHISLPIGLFYYIYTQFLGTNLHCSRYTRFDNYYLLSQHF